MLFMNASKGYMYLLGGHEERNRSLFVRGKHGVSVRLLFGRGNMAKGVWGHGILASGNRLTIIY